MQKAQVSVAFHVTPCSKLPRPTLDNGSPFDSVGQSSLLIYELLLIVIHSLYSLTSPVRMQILSRQVFDRELQKWLCCLSLDSVHGFVLGFASRVSQTTSVKSPLLLWLENTKQHLLATSWSHNVADNSLAAYSYLENLGAWARRGCMQGCGRLGELIMNRYGLASPLGPSPSYKEVSCWAVSTPIIQKVTFVPIAIFK